MQRFKYRDYFITIGLEIHVALSTKKKLFSQTPNSFFSESFDLLDVGLPGVLPVLNEEAVKLACIFGLATNSKINLYSEFERKHYFYPDLCLGYQITQQHKPILGEGVIPIEVNGVLKKIEIEHSHLECDAAKSLHDLYSDFTAIDVSRGGSVLLEIVSKPCMHSALEAKEYAKTIHSIVKAVDVCDGKLEEGSFRVDASISVSKDENVLGTRVEIKNISSFAFLEEALLFEMERQVDAINNGIPIKMETRLFNEQTKETASMREKETVNDYKYMQDPDLPAIQLSEEYIFDIKSNYFIEYFDLIGFYQKYEIKKEKTIEVLNSNLRYLVIDLFKIKDLENKLLQKAIKAVFYWLSESISKKDNLIIPNLGEIIEVLKNGIEAKEFKDLVLKWNDNSDKKFSSLYEKASFDESEMESLIIDYCNKNIDAIKDEKLSLDKKSSFIMGKIMKEHKGKFQASILSEKIKIYIDKK